MNHYAVIHCISYYYSVPPQIVLVVKDFIGLQSRDERSFPLSIEFSIINASPPVGLSGIQWQYSNYSTENATDLIQTSSGLFGDGKFTLSPDLQTLTLQRLMVVDKGEAIITVTNPAGSDTVNVDIDIEGESHSFPSVII